MRDTIYTAPRDLVDFAFDESVAGVFPDMIRRSVPAYTDVITLTGLIAGEYAQPDSACYDLGCSLGATTLAMRRQIRAPGCRLIAIDNAPAMLERCRHNVGALASPVPVEVRYGDLRTVTVENASVVAVNFTLQFVPPEERDGVLSRIHQGLRPGGVLLLAEKIVCQDPQEQAFRERMHLAFKKANGYSELEISAKRSALENVLIPDTRQVIERRLEKAGFSSPFRWLRCFNFTAFAAFK